MKLRKRTGLAIANYSLSLILTMIATCFMPQVFGQNSKDSTRLNPSSNGDDTSNPLVEYTRPGKYHQLLADLVGTWTVKGKAFSGDANSNKVVFQFQSTAVRKPFANGRFFIVTVSGDAIEVPLQNGSMKKEEAQVIITEGYDNVKNKFEQTSISNHIGSDILYGAGVYDSAKRTITFDFEQELAPGIKDKVRELFIMIDKDHYTLEYYQEQKGVFIKVNEVSYTRAR